MPKPSKSIKTVRNITSSEPVRGVLEMARNVDMALLSAVDLSAQSKALEYDVISRQLWQSLRDAGAVGDICSHYLDADGKPVAHPIAARTINPSLDDLRNVPELILAAGGRQKVAIIRGAILARLCHVLITDEIAASARGAGMPADAASSIEDALTAIGSLGFDPPPRILITGSLYLAGEVLAANGTELV